MNLNHWTGHTNKFRIHSPTFEPYTYFVLNDDQAGSSQIATPSTILRGGKWQFRFYINGKEPTKTTQARFYVASNSANLQAPLQGYFLAIGVVNERLTGSTRQFLAFYRQNGSLTDTTHIFDCHKEFLLSKNTLFQVTITCDAEGHWKLYGQLGDSSTRLWGSGQDATYTHSTHLGIYCQYPKSTSANCAFGNIIATHQ